MSLQNKTFSYCVCWFLHLDVPVFDLFLFAMMVFQEQVTSAQSRTCFAAEPQPAAGFQATLTEVQGQSGIYSRTESLVELGLHPIPSVSLASCSLL